MTESSPSSSPSMFETMGASSGAEEAYLALLNQHHGGSTSSSDDTVSAQILGDKKLASELVDTGLVRIDDNNLLPVSPRLVVERWSLAMESRARELRAAAELLESRFPQGHQGSLEIVQGRAEATRAFVDFQLSAKSVLECFDRPPYFADGASLMSPVQQEVIDRGVQYRTLYLSEVLEDPAQLAATREAVALGEEARAFSQVPIRMLIADRSSAILLLPYGVDVDGRSPLRIDAIIVSQSGLLDSLIQLFDLLWGFAEPLAAFENSAEDGAEAGDAEQRRQLLSMLAVGMTDASIARELGVSERTVSRKIGRLSEILGAASRFQLGYKAAKRGLL